MANPSAPQLTGESFDENGFFRHLRTQPQNTDLCELMASFDSRAAVQMARYVVQYLRPFKETDLFAARKQRARDTQRALSDTILRLRKAAERYRAAAKIQTPSGPLLSAGDPIWPAEMPFLGEVLEREADRLSGLLLKYRILADTKRLGLSGNSSWLVMLEEFTAAWTKHELGKARRLTAREIAALIEAGKRVEDRDTNISPTNPSTMKRAIRNFRSKPANKALLASIAVNIRTEVASVQRRAYLVGFKV